MAIPPKKSNNDVIKKSSTKEGSSNSRLDFISSDDDLYDISDADIELESEFLEEDDDDDEEYYSDNSESDSDLDDPEIGDFLDFGYDNNKSLKPKVTVIERKIDNKKPEEPPKFKAVAKQAKKLLSEYASDVPAEEIDKFLEITGTMKDQMINGPMNFTGKNNPTQEDKKDFFNKLQGLKSSDDISRVNAAFVLKWLKKRST